MASITQLEYLIAVDKHRHFALAAKACHVSQPSLSIQLQNLEEELGTILFDRSKRPIIPTERGKKIIAQAKIALKEHSRIFEIVHQDEGPSGPFRLAVIPTLAPYVIPLFVHEFSQSYPLVDLKIVEDKTENIVALLEEDAIDAGLLVTPLHNDRLIERPLYVEPIQLFIGPGHPFQRKAAIKPEELSKEKIWLLHEGHCFRDQVINLCQFPKEQRPIKNVVFESGNLETLINLVKSGPHLTLVPQLASTNLSKADQKKYLRPFKGHSPAREVSIVHARSFLKEDTIEALCQSIVDSLPDEIKSHRKRKVDIIEFA